VFVAGSSLCAAPAGVYKTTRSSAAISFLKELLDDLFTLLVLAFPELVITNVSGCIHDVIARPRAIVEGPPDGIVVVDGDRISDLQIMHCFLNVGQVSFKGELRSMHADHEQAARLIFISPGPQIRQCSKTVNAGISPEIIEDDFPFQGIGRKRRGIEPRHSAGY